METPPQKKASPCSCGSGTPAFRCCHKARTRTSSPEGALELLCFLRNTQATYLKTELVRHTGLSRYNVESVVAWARPAKLIKTVSHRDGWTRYRADADAINAWMAGVGQGAPAPRAHAKRTKTRSDASPRTTRRSRARAAAVAA